MENTYITNNLIIKQLNQSDAIAYNLDYLASPTNNDFNLLNKAYEFTGKIYAKMKLSIQNGTCVSENCELEIKKLLELEAAPQKSLDFLSDLISQVSVVDEPNYDPNNNFVFTKPNIKQLKLTDILDKDPEIKDISKMSYEYIMQYLKMHKNYDTIKSLDCLVAYEIRKSRVSFRFDNYKKNNMSNCV